MKVNILSGADAQRALTDHSFLRVWRSLHAKCPWATVCQGVDFCVAWYETYRDDFTPLMVSGTDDNGQLVGLLTLGIARDRGDIVAAGAHQAEYQVWIATPEAGEEFIEAALGALRGHFPGRVVKFLFLPPKTPLGWTMKGRTWSGVCALRKIPLAVMAIGDGSTFGKSLRKKSNKSRLNRLERIGPVQLRQLTTPQELEAIFDKTMVFATLRLGAMFHQPVSPHPEPLKKAFYLRMMHAPRLLHATVLTVGEQLISTHIGHYNRNQVMLGILAYSPFFARHSPSKIHLLMLGEHLAQEGIDVFDLTPGGEYKERFATDADEAFILTVFLSSVHYLRYKATRQVALGAKKLLTLAGSSPEQLKNVVRRVEHKWRLLNASGLPLKAARTVQKYCWSTSQMRVYKMNADIVAGLGHSQLMKRDCLEDLMSYSPAEAWQPPVSDFLQQALENLETGTHIYTLVEDRKLLHYGWLIERQTKSFLTEVGQELYLPPDSTVLANFYTHPMARGRGMYHASLSQMLHDAVEIPSIKQIYICVMADNYPSLHVIEKLGFEYQCSFFKRRRLGRTMRWSNSPLLATPPEGNLSR